MHAAQRRRWGCAVHFPINPWQGAIAGGRKMPNPAAAAVTAADSPVLLRRRDDQAQIQVVEDNGGAYGISAMAGGCR